MLKCSAGLLPTVTLLIDGLTLDGILYVIFLLTEPKEVEPLYVVRVIVALTLVPVVLAFAKVNEGVHDTLVELVLLAIVPL